MDTKYYRIYSVSGDGKSRDTAFIRLGWNGKEWDNKGYARTYKTEQGLKGALRRANKVRSYLGEREIKVITSTQCWSSDKDFDLTL